MPCCYVLLCATLMVFAQSKINSHTLQTPCMGGVLMAMTQSTDVFGKRKAIQSPPPGQLYRLDTFRTTFKARRCHVSDVVAAQAEMPLTPTNESGDEQGSSTSPPHTNDLSGLIPPMVLTNYDPMSSTPVDLPTEPSTPKHLTTKVNFQFNFDEQSQQRPTEFPSSSPLRYECGFCGRAFRQKRNAEQHFFCLR